MIVLFHAMMTDTENKAVIYGVQSSHLQGVKQSFTERKAVILQGVKQSFTGRKAVIYKVYQWSLQNGERV